jgi:hypothetical protein
LPRRCASVGLCVTGQTEHDRAFLEKREPSLPFAWMLTEDATHLVGAEWIDRRGHGAHDYVGWVQELGYVTRYYFWNGIELEEHALACALQEQLKENALNRAAG